MKVLYIGLAFLTLLVEVAGCATSTVTPASPSYDIPQLSSRDAIIMVIEYNERSLEKLTGIPIPRQSKSSRQLSGDWNCRYLGDGVWSVTLRDPEGYFQWYVYEKGMYVTGGALRH